MSAPLRQSDSGALLDARSWEHTDNDVLGYVLPCMNALAELGFAETRADDLARDLLDLAVKHTLARAVPTDEFDLSLLDIPEDDVQLAAIIGKYGLREIHWFVVIWLAAPARWKRASSARLKALHSAYARTFERPPAIIVPGSVVHHTILAAHRGHLAAGRRELETKMRDLAKRSLQKRSPKSKAAREKFVKRFLELRNKNSQMSLLEGARKLATAFEHKRLRIRKKRYAERTILDFLKTAPALRRRSP